MATVFLARDLKHKRSVALKVLHPELAHALGPERFQREIELAARLQHPHILTVFDSGTAAGYLWFTMPFVDGESLRDRLTRERQLPVEDAMRIAIEVAGALDYAHQHGVVHRDIKPENILITREGAPLVADLGIARALGGEEERITESGLSVGTPAYMSPEQAAADPNLDARSDIYSLGAVLFEMLAGQPPFTGVTHGALVRQLLTMPSPPVSQFRPKVPAPIVEAISRSLSKLPADRFDTMQQFAAVLHRGSGVPAARAAAGPRVALLAGTILLVAGALWWSLHTHSTAAESFPQSIAVLPFRNLTGDSAGDYFSDGVTEEILHALTQISDLRVAARTSAFRFKGDSVDVREVGHQLGVATVLEGSVQREGDAIRITTQLIDTRTGYQLWSGKFDRHVADLFAIEDEISRALSDTLKVSLGLVPRPVEGTPSVEAHDLYLRGLSLLAQRGAALQQSIGYFEGALQRDSTFAPAWAGLAAAYELLPAYYLSSYAAVLPQAEAAARRAIALDSLLGPAYAVLGSVYRDRLQWVEADRAYQHALVLAPNDPETIEQYGQLIFWSGRPEAAIPWMERARRLDPLAPIPTLTTGVARLFLHQYDSAAVLLARATELGPGLGLPLMWRMWAELSMGRYDSAEVAGRRVAELSGVDPAIYTTLVRGVAAPAGRAEALRLLARTPGNARWALNSDYRANWYVLLGDTAMALELVDRLKTAPSLNAILALWNPPLDPIRAQPRFQSTLAQLGLPYRGATAKQ